MSSACTCHVDIDSCIWCRIQVMKGVIDNYEDCNKVIITKPKELIDDFYWLFGIIEDKDKEIEALQETSILNGNLVIKYENTLKRIQKCYPMPTENIDLIPIEVLFEIQSIIRKTLET